MFSKQEFELATFKLFQIKYTNQFVLQAKCFKAIIMNLQSKLKEGVEDKRLEYTGFKETTLWDTNRLVYVNSFFVSVQVIPNLFDTKLIRFRFYTGKVPWKAALYASQAQDGTYCSHRAHHRWSRGSNGFTFQWAQESVGHYTSAGWMAHAFDYAQCIGKKWYCGVSFECQILFECASR